MRLEANLLDRLTNPDHTATLAEIERSEEIEILTPRQVSVKSRGLDESADHVRDRSGKRVDAPSEHTDVTSVASNQSKQDAKQRRLASPIRPEQSMHPA